MIWCWGNEVTREESWRGLRGSEEVIERRRDADDMVNLDKEKFDEKKGKELRLS